MRIVGITPDCARGPGYALIEFDQWHIDQLELAFFDIDRREYLRPSSRGNPNWHKEPFYFTACRADRAAPVFGVGPEVCNFLQPDSFVRISSRDQAIGEDRIWPGVPIRVFEGDEHQPIEPLQGPTRQTSPGGADLRSVQESGTFDHDVISRAGDQENAITVLPEISKTAAPEHPEQQVPPLEIEVQEQSKLHVPATNLKSLLADQAGPTGSRGDGPSSSEIGRSLTVAGVLMVVAIAAAYVVVTQHNDRERAWHSGPTPQNQRFRGPQAGPFEPREMRISLADDHVGRTWSIHLPPQSHINVSPMSGRQVGNDRITLTVTPNDEALELTDGSYTDMFLVSGPSGEAGVWVGFEISSPTFDGMKIANISPARAQTLHIGSRAGVLITEIAGGTAAMAGLAKGDVITAINGKEIGDIADFEQITQQRKVGWFDWALDVSRAGQRLSIAIRDGAGLAAPPMVTDFHWPP